MNENVSAMLLKFEAAYTDLSLLASPRVEEASITAAVAPEATLSTCR